jgi:hypothetical protein
LEPTFGESFRKKWNLSKYSDPNAPSIFFGLYKEDDIQTLVQHNSHSIVIWGGADMRPQHLEIVKSLVLSGRCSTVAYPGEFSKILAKHQIPHKSFYFAIKDFSGLSPVPLGDKIYVYRGIKGTRPDYFQWEKVVVPLIDFFGKDRVIFTDNLEFQELVKSFYSKAFIYVKPTPKGGCTSMFELGCMGIKTVGMGHFPLPNFIQYRNLTHLIRIITKESKKIGTIQTGVSNQTFEVLNQSNWLDLDFWKKDEQYTRRFD